jgi:hypothetical protein
MTSTSAAQRTPTLARRTGADGIYGGSDVAERAARWAAERGLRLSTSRHRCAHGLRRLGGRRAVCPCDPLGLLDHAALWVRAGRPVVLLAHTYLDLDTATERADAYATEHGLTVFVGDEADAWYGCGAVPLRFEATPSSWTPDVGGEGA